MSDEIENKDQEIAETATNTLEQADLLAEEKAPDSSEKGEEPKEPTPDTTEQPSLT